MPWAARALQWCLQRAFTMRFFWGSVFLFILRSEEGDIFLGGIEKREGDFFFLFLFDTSGALPEQRCFGESE